MESIIFIMLVTFLINIPFGWLREGVKKFSFLWFVYVHTPIPFIVALRIALRIPWKFAPFLILIAIFGQYAGAKIRRKQLAITN
ncbi:hypothetical protein Dester_1132 [Desulfurobacterium thermolithotrophum DSM 11699]|uniref:Uncharacterized protein n=1 Tax=Desulfurobacterium thermolithotrophum (strain DSM 11699 / BSA) TaxID=868864 RepID=F0S090_DESTD|nr:hypothetical protein [Desulfurobacterium thermolithotrophum]ADY73769.1 hypothetical protein Dester_1132 [Desulfurobacterium thermolithotrophum DSM 11699]